MSKNTKNIGTQRHQTPFRAPATATDAKGKIMTLLKQKGLSVSDSDLLRIVTKLCFAPHRQGWEPHVIGPMHERDLKHFLTPRFRAWAQPLIETREVVVTLDEFSNGLWILLVWVSREYLFKRHVQELEMLARQTEKASKTGKIPNKTMSVYLTAREKRTLRRQAERMSLKRARNGGESRMLRLVASYGLADFLEYLESKESVGSLGSIPRPKRENPDLT
jgi:hypothetical protein